MENEQDKRKHGKITIGERHSQCKLTIEKVLEIKKLHKKSCQKHGAAALAKVYGVSPWQIRNIVSGGGWTDAIAQAALKDLVNKEIDSGKAIKKHYKPMKVWIRMSCGEISYKLFTGIDSVTNFINNFDHVYKFNEDSKILAVTPADQDYFYEGENL